MFQLIINTLQMLNDWKVDPNGYPRLLQMFQMCYGSMSATKDGDSNTSYDTYQRKASSYHHNNKEDDSSITDNLQDNNSISSVENSIGSSSNTNSLSNSNSSSYPSRSDWNPSRYTQQVHNMEITPCCLEELTNISLQQPQQKEFERLEKRFSELFSHACLTVHSIDKIIRHAKEDGVPKALPSLNDFSDTDKYTRNSTTPIHKSLLTIVNNTTYGSSGGGIICYYLLTKYVKPLNKVRTLIAMLESSEKQDLVNRTAIESYFLNGETSGLDVYIFHLNCCCFCFCFVLFYLHELSI